MNTLVATLPETKIALENGWFGDYLLLQLLLPFWHIFRDHVSLRGCVIPLKKGPVFSRSQWPLWALRPRSGPKRFQTSIHGFGKLGLGKGAPTLPLAAAFLSCKPTKNEKTDRKFAFLGIFFRHYVDIAKFWGSVVAVSLKT